MHACRSSTIVGHFFPNRQSSQDWPTISERKITHYRSPPAALAVPSDLARISCSHRIRCFWPWIVMSSTRPKTPGLGLSAAVLHRVKRHFTVRCISTVPRGAFAPRLQGFAVMRGQP